ncbi:Zn(II)2Cys6 transcription factor [Aspergillus melleus]|uniref:Zn(II)2Cys6 transcription factor n=1 Tax=Aspergillus melleus TaxID=138277 RepID=UPI001E8E5744|nr:uncharacterized protein LDX57_005358 [Aspergillus melleus]KAH8427646.1 hypothetical protein LDX57_005358 [Aspergillus melleus]
MTGVPYSTGCSLCLARRVKCDEATPSCTQCLKYGRPCPGYTRTFRFQDEGPRLERRHALSAAPITTTSSSSPRKRNITTLNPASGAAAAADVHDHALALMHRGQVHAQQMQPHGPSNAGSLYCNSGLDAFLCHDMQATLPITDINTLLRTIFHTHYHHNLFRLPHEPDARQLRNIANSPFQYASTACLLSIYQAQISNDPTQLETSRELYAQAIREVVSGLYGDAALSVDMLSATMNLALYEMLARTSPGAWVVHVEGVRRLMRNQGAEGHVGVLAREIFLVFRGFLVLAAFEQREKCFLEEEEWRALRWRVAREDLARAGGGGGMARWVDVEERVFGEVVRLPGFVAAGGRGGGERLGREMGQTRQRLVQLGMELRAGMEAETPQIRVAGVTMPDRGPGLLLQGVESAVALLDRLLARRHSDGRFRPFRLVCALNEGPAAMPPIEGITWLDQLASSFGMIGVKVVDGQ